MTRRRRSTLVWVLIVAFVAVPLVEIFALVRVGQVIGAWWTIALLVADSIVGGWLVKREGGRAWTALRAALAGGRMPSRELADGALILVGGTLMLTPGFVTDGVGVLLILPLTRPVARRLLTAVLARRLLAAGGVGRPDTTRPGPGSQGPVIRGEVVDE